MNAESSPSRVGTAHQPGTHETRVPSPSVAAPTLKRFTAFPAACAIFEPTCSHYGVGCLEKHGLIRGGWLTLRRLVRCHPFAKGGHDPVP